MAKPQVYQAGKTTSSVNVYSEDHRHWGDELYYHDVDGIEWTVVNDRWYPVAVIEECSETNERRDRREWTLPRVREVAEAFSLYYGYPVRAYFVRWIADHSAEVGRRIGNLHVQCLYSGTEAIFTRQSWIEHLLYLRRRIRKRFTGFTSTHPSR